MEVTKFNSNLKKLLKDMAETMYDAEGVGLRLRRSAFPSVLSWWISGTKMDLIEMVNPVIVEQRASSLDLRAA